MTKAFDMHSLYLTLYFSLSPSFFSLPSYIKANLLHIIMSLHTFFVFREGQRPSGAFRPRVRGGVVGSGSRGGSGSGSRGGVVLTRSISQGGEEEAEEDR